MFCWVEIKYSAVNVTLYSHLYGSNSILIRGAKIYFVVGSILHADLIMLSSDCFGIQKHNFDRFSWKGRAFPWIAIPILYNDNEFILGGGVSCDDEAYFEDVLTTECAYVFSDH
ncbi:hypothetical protein KIN20_013279 [Parelaphostrongylus tenuis]|uniref:Uncharacterized protein n=1 Tax=Parelaphostrongylus tenuis TaxID=148309 RepID=A0AAD5MD88_PARTN|nr:hypothetical protein KIN20_013279 [Parelaphostrongylus tenuis]